MDYLNIYNAICARGQERKAYPNSGLERHHILPESCGGTSAPSNMTALTPREHYLCHKLLVKIYKDNPVFRKKMVYALWWMSKTRCKKRGGKVRITCRDYERARQRFLEEMPTKQKGYADRFRKKHAAGEYNYDYNKVSQTMKKWLASLTPEEKSERIKKSALSGDPKKRAESIRRGKASLLRLITSDNETHFWSYDDVKSITGYTYSQIRYRIKAHDGLLENGNRVEYIKRYKGNDVRRKNNNSS